MTNPFQKTSDAVSNHSLLYDAHLQFPEIQFRQIYIAHPKHPLRKRRAHHLHVDATSRYPLKNPCSQYKISHDFLSKLYIAHRHLWGDKNTEYPSAQIHAFEKENS